MLSSDSGASMMSVSDAASAGRLDPASTSGPVSSALGTPPRAQKRLSIDIPQASARLDSISVHEVGGVSVGIFEPAAALARSGGDDTPASVDAQEHEKREGSVRRNAQKRTAASVAHAVAHLRSKCSGCGRVFSATASENVVRVLATPRDATLSTPPPRASRPRAPERSASRLRFSPIPMVTH
jgi:hypothetical protein